MPLEMAARVVQSTTLFQTEIFQQYDMIIVAEVQAFMVPRGCNLMTLVTPSFLVKYLDSYWIDCHKSFLHITMLFGDFCFD